MQTGKLKKIFHKPAIPSALVLLLLCSPPLSTAETSGDADAPLLKMLELARKQQEQLRIQADQIRERAKVIEELKRQVDAMAPQDSPSLKEAPQTVTSVNDRIKLSVSGQINRAVNIVSDGSATRLYHVDNSASGSRFRFVGTAGLNSDFVLGTRLEVGITPDRSSLVSQTDQTPSDFLTVRWADISLESRLLGKLYIGKGDTASKGTAVKDLSRTDVVQYINVGLTGGGLRFRESDAGHRITNVKVRDSFKSLDGLGRISRLRYDTPSFMGAFASASVAGNHKSDLGLHWGARGFGLQAAAGAALSNHRTSGSALQYDGSLSVLHVASGLNLTFSGGIQNRKTGKDATNLYAKLGWIANLNRLGYTAFGVDYTNSGNLPATDNRGYSAGAAVVQSFDSLATELYLQYRIYSLKQAIGPRLDDIQITTIGARIKF